mmetsp:Transcript_92149/g.264120  ORF Transcript_92149/g.264120 Transcript_92149/m.264120 type:complete len:257 (-) Transcript_92149:57-827(-)
MSYLCRAPSRAGDVLVLAASTIAALRMNAISEAAQDVRGGIPALWLPVVLVGMRWQRKLRLQGAQRGRTVHLRVRARATEAAADVLPVGLAAHHAILAGRIPEVGRLRFVVELATVLRRDCVCLIGAMHGAIVGVLPAEAALHLLAVGQAADTANGASRVPIVRDVRRVVELAPRGGAEDLAVCALPTEAALRVDAVCQATERGAILRTRGVPEVGNRWRVGEVASIREAPRLHQGRCGRERQDEHEAAHSGHCGC